MTHLLVEFAIAADNSTSVNLGWRDALTALVALATVWVGISTARTSRKTNKDSIEAQSYLRADQVSGETINRLRQDILRVREENEQREVRHEHELAERDRRIESLENRLRRSERRSEQLAKAIRDGGGTVPAWEP